MTFILTRSFLVFFMESQPQDISYTVYTYTHGFIQRGQCRHNVKKVSIFHVFSFPVIKPSVSEGIYLLLSWLCLYLAIPSYYSIYSMCSRLYILKYTESIRGSWYTKQEKHSIFSGLVLFSYSLIQQAPLVEWCQSFLTTCKRT